MKIVVVGWYGTETIGDRGILAGLVKIFANTFGDFEIKLGSLYPFFSRRTISEDYKFWKIITSKDLKIDVFDSSKPSELNRAIRESDLVVMGGGPLMHISELFMVEYAFRRAKKLKKRSAILGCGVGPIFNNKYHRALLNIINIADLVILRDSNSLKQLKDVFLQQKQKEREGIAVSLDPAVIACGVYNQFRADEKIIDEDLICVNLRSFPQEYSVGSKSAVINKRLAHFVSELASYNSEKLIKLVPMHYFHIGNDDRVFLNQIQMQVNAENITAQNAPLSLLETLKMFSRASICYGMRFHSVVFQTLVSGNNYILDYTEPGKGKISGFLDEIDHIDFYTDRYLNLQSDEDNLQFKYLGPNLGFNVDSVVYDDTLNSYVASLLYLH